MENHAQIGSPGRPLRARFRARIGIPVAVALLTTIAACDIFSRWDALVYVNKFDRGNSIDLGTFDSLEACRAAALAKLAELKGGELSGYICGENCLVKSGFNDTRMCARTSR